MRFSTAFKRFVILCISVFITHMSLSQTCFAISIPEEQKLGREFMAMVHNQNMLLKDPIVNHFINQIGKHLLTHVPPQPFKFSFYAVDEDVFNAFAAPGANIFLYRGLITSLDSADEVAGILGHEIAHSISRHVSESIDRSKYISIGSMAGIIAGALIGGKTDASAGQTIMTGSLALGYTSMLAFTRENETEADEKGIMFLKQSCFEPEGLLSGLMKIRDSDYRGAEGIPDYVKTHPGTTTRIAHAETILLGYQPPSVRPDCPTNFDFDMVKYRLIGQYSDVEKAFTDLTNMLLKSDKNSALHYGMGLVYARKQRLTEAIHHFKKALSIRMFDPLILLELGRVYLLSGDPEKALNVLTGMETEAVIGLTAKFHQANANLELALHDKAEQGYRTIIRKAPKSFPKAYFNLAKIKSTTGEKGLSHYYLGIHYSLIGNHKNATLHLNKAVETLKDPDKLKDAENRLGKIKKRKK